MRTAGLIDTVSGSSIGCRTERTLRIVDDVSSRDAVFPAKLVIEAAHILLLIDRSRYSAGNCSELDWCSSCTVADNNGLGGREHRIAQLARYRPNRLQKRNPRVAGKGRSKLLHTQR